jgi:hypothetical protein
MKVNHFTIIIGTYVMRPFHFYLMHKPETLWIFFSIAGFIILWQITYKLTEKELSIALKRTFTFRFFFLIVSYRDKKYLIFNGSLMTLRQWYPTRGRDTQGCRENVSGLPLYIKFTAFCLGFTSLGTTDYHFSRIRVPSNYF